VTAVAERVTAPAWLAALREQGAARFAELGFPTTRDEEWRFTPVAPIAEAGFGPAAPATVTAAALAPFIFGHAEWPRLVFVNGRYDAALSSVAALPAGVRVASLAEALAADPSLEQHLGRHVAVDATPLVAQNTASFEDGAVVTVAPNADAGEVPVHLVYVTAPGTAGASHGRNVIVVGRGARAALVESYVALGGHADTYYTNVVSELVVAENAWVEHVRIQRESEKAYHVGLTHVEQARDSHYRNFTFTMGGKISRHDLHCRLNAENVETLMYGLYLGRDEQLVDNHTVIHHDHPECRSWEVYKGVLDDRSHGVFNGKIFVQPEAQKTDAKQTNRALLLSDTARIDTKPQLEIFADDVKCTHGATVGNLDDLMQFYFRSRGIPADAARRHLVYAFCAEVMAEVQIEAVRTELERLVLDRVNA
jgi:Fe-S cluster assembly protein SufD